MDLLPPLSIADAISLRPRMRRLSATSICHMTWLCDGWHMAILDERLCVEPAQASHLGPCYPGVVEGWYHRSVMRGLGQDVSRPAALSREQDEIVDHVVSRYGDLGPERLRQACARPGTGAWWAVYSSDEGLNSTIPPSAAKAEFLELARLAQAAQAA